MALQVVSTPAMSTRAATPRTSRSSTGWPSNSECSRSLSRSSPGSVFRRATSSTKKPIRPFDPLGPADRVVGELEDVPHPAGEAVRQGGGHAEDAGDDPHGDLLGVVPCGVGGSCGHEPVDQLGAQGPGHGLVALHPGVGEPREQEPTGPGVEGGVGRDRRQAVEEHRVVRPLAPEGDDADLGGAEVLDVMGQVHHVLVPGGQPGAAPPLGVGHRAGPAQLVPDPRRDRPRTRGSARRSRCPSGPPVCRSSCSSCPSVGDAPGRSAILSRRLTALSGAGGIRSSVLRRRRGPTPWCTRTRPRPGRPPRRPSRPAWRSPGAT